jgi:sporulation protein YlmC with PRC-barrel domain
MQPPGEPFGQPGEQTIPQGAGGMPPYREPPSQQETGGQAPGQAPGAPYAQPGQQAGIGNWVLASQLRGHPLVDASKGQKVGEVQDVLLDQQLQSIQAFTYKAGLFQGSGIVPAAQARIGVDAVTFLPGAQARPDTSMMKDLPKASEVIGRRVLTDTGRLLGVVGDLRFDQNNHRLLGIELGPEVGGRQRLGGRPQLLPTDSILNFGPDVVIVNERWLAGF